MNCVRRFIAMSLLILAIAATPALAGDMPGPGSVPPPPPQVTVAGETQGPGLTGTASTNTSVTGNMPQGNTHDINPLTELALSLLQSVFSLF